MFSTVMRQAKTARESGLTKDVVHGIVTMQLVRCVDAEVSSRQRNVVTGKWRAGYVRT